MRILYVTPLYLPWLGGLEILCSQLLAELVARGHEVAVLTAVNDHSVPLGEDVVQGVRVLRTDVYEARREVPMDLLLIQREVARFTADFAPDVTHAHDPGALLWVYQRGAARRSPLLVTIHNVMTHHAPKQLESMARMVRLADWVVGVSDDVVQDTRTFASLSAGRESVVVNGVVPPGPAPAPVADGPARLLSVGRLVPQKGFDLALEALALVVRERPEVRLDIVGEGPEERHLREQIKALGLVQHARLLGRVEHARIAGLMAAATAVVMPSRFEGMPLVALEAGRTGRPVVGTAAPGLRCAVVDGHTGLLVPAEDPRALAAALLRVVDDRDLARKLGAAARERIEVEHSLTRCVDEYEELYSRLVQERAA
ncbi:MAG: glycosyltransferase family 4 protein [Candidatus Dormibacteria bacterium]